jgi:hypothetical protein
MKKVLLAIALCVGLATPVHASQQPTVVLIDSGVNDSLFTSNIVYEACFIENTTCANGRNSMEGIGSAQQVSSNNMEVNHGEQMLSIMVKVNPKVQVIPIKIVGVTSLGNPYLYSLASIKSALDWVVANQAKYNIGVVSISQGAIFANCSVPYGLQQDVNILQGANVQVVAATGNTSNRTQMFAPACLSNVISVGATDNPWGGSQPYAWDPQATPTIGMYSNGNAQTTLYSNARYFVTNLNGTVKFMAGTSNATAAVASWLTLNRGSNWTTTYSNLIASASGTATNKWLTGRYLFINS